MIIIYVVIGNFIFVILYNNAAINHLIKKVRRFISNKVFKVEDNERIANDLDKNFWGNDL
jgi:hypothetical protein